MQSCSGRRSCDLRGVEHREDGRRAEWLRLRLGAADWPRGAASGCSHGPLCCLKAGRGGGPARAQEIIRRFKHAEVYVQRMKDVGKHEMFTMTQCPKNFSIGFRTTKGQLIPEYAGNTCEPWVARFALIFLDRLLDSGTAPPL